MSKTPIYTGRDHQLFFIEPEDSKPVSSTTEKYYPTVAINALVRVMRDPTLTVHHRSVIESLMPILKVTQ